MRCRTLGLFLGLATSVLAQDSTVNQYYSALLNDSLWFYEAQRSGKLPANNRVDWRHDSGLEDGSDHNIDLVGGYYDAGDYLKFTIPLAHSLVLVAWGGIEWYDGYAKTNRTQDLYDMMRWGTDWLIKAHPDPNILYLQVGDGDVDNNYWGPDTSIPTPRPSYMINATAPGTDAAALTAAAFASAACLFKNQLNDSSYAETLLSHAISLYSFAETAQPFQVYTNAIPQGKDFYDTNVFYPQLVYGAQWIFRATGNTTYRDKASTYFDQGQLAAATTPLLDWSDPTGAVYVLGAGIDNTNTKYSTAAKSYLDTIITAKKGGPCSFTSGGLLWCGGYSNSNSLIPAQDTALLALLYNVYDKSRESDYNSFAIKQIDYMLGNNMMLTPYVVGVHMNSPVNPHHAGASGGTDIGNIDSSPAVEAHVLYGAVVGGPDEDDKFFDERSDYDQTEVALDYNAPFQSLVAYQISAGAGDPPYASITQPRPKVTRSHHIQKWLIAVIVIVVVFALAAIGYLAWLKRYRLCGGYNKSRA
ncbi:Six-hairpin glycosidase-like protein [Phycomyces blakesleeanus]